MTTEQTDDATGNTDVDPEVGGVEKSTETDTDEPVRRARGEAAAYRRRLRDTEGERDALAVERDQLRAQLHDRQRADVEALAAERLRDGSDLWTATTLSDLLDDDGKPDKAKVLEAIDQLVASKPHYATPRPQFDLGHRGGTAETGPSFADVLRGGTRHGS